MEIKLITPKIFIEIQLVEAIEGARFAKKSLGKSDSEYNKIGEKDLELALKLAFAPIASGHDKFLQQIHFSIDIDMSRFMWQEFDTYRIGISKQSESTMHTLINENITLDCFDLSKYSLYEYEYIKSILELFIKQHQELRTLFNNKSVTDSEYRNILKAILPESFKQKRRVSMNYANVKLINEQRKNHRNKEWHIILDYLKSELPYSNLIFKE